ncbi:MAG: ACR3 family arsenite efflux transporter [Pseudobacteriovorax sp.]|nr:ACR3 family arsenite efflux transporter [Pseudobacteriovorax sp.]
MGTFERYLSIWVGLCIILGLALGNLSPDNFQQVSAWEIANVNLLVAALIWLMIFPMMVQVDFSAVKKVGSKPKGLILTLTVNWLVKPFSMALITMLFFQYIFADLVDPQSAKEYIAGMILLGVAPCTAMVFVWSQMTQGDPNYTLVQVSINDLIMMVLFAPIAGALLGVTDISVPWSTLALSVLLYVVIPLVAGVILRRQLNRQNERQLHRFVALAKPFSIFGLLATVVLLFGFQAQTILAKPMIVVLIAIPLMLQSYGIFAIAYLWAYRWRLPHNIAAPAAMIGTSNFFELAVAVAIGMFGLNSGAALATVVGVLIEVPVMLSLVYFANRTRGVFTERVEWRKA